MGRVAALALCSYLLVQMASPQGPTKSLDFRPAFLESEELRFESATPLDWAQIARQNFHAFDLSHPDLAQVKERWSEVTSAATFAYQAPLPSPGQHSFYYAVCATGLAEVKPEKLVGQILFPTDPAMKPSGPPQYTGTLSGKIACPGPPPDPGFVLISDMPRTFEISAVAVGEAQPLPGIEKKIEGNQAVYSYNDREGHHVELGRHALKFPGLQQASLIKVSGDPASYLFVRWAPDKDCTEGCCEFSYALYRLEKEVKPVLTNDYGCDV